MVSAPPIPPTPCFRVAARRPTPASGSPPATHPPPRLASLPPPLGTVLGSPPSPPRRARVNAVDPPKPLGSTPSIDPTPRIGSTLSTAPSSSGRRRRPATALGSTPSTRTCPRLAAVAPPAVLRSTLSIRPGPPGRPAGRHRRPDPTDRVDAIDRPKLLGSTPSPRHRTQVDAVDPHMPPARRRRPAHAPRVDAVDPPIPPGSRLSTDHCPRVDPYDCFSRAPAIGAPARRSVRGWPRRESQKPVRETSNY